MSTSHAGPSTTSQIGHIAIAIVLGTAAGFGTAAWRKRASGVASTSSSSPPSTSSTTLRTTPSSDAAASRAPAIVERLARLWAEGTGTPGPMTPAAQEILAAQAWLESGLAEPGDGGYWKGEMQGSGNLGARQGDRSEQNGTPNGAGWRLAKAQDSKPNSDGSQTTFSVLFRYYIDGGGRSAGENAALDYLHSIRQFGGPQGLAALQAGNIQRYAEILYDGPSAANAIAGTEGGPTFEQNAEERRRHFGGLRRALAAERQQLTETHGLDEEEDETGGYYGGFGKTREERIAGYVKAIVSHVPAVAAALGHDHIFATIPSTS